MLSEFFLMDETRLLAEIDYSYDYWLVALSCAIAIFAAYTAFQLVPQIIAAPNHLARLNWLGTGAVAMGCGIWSMHFIAMLAVEMDHEMRYDPALTALSLAFAIAASAFAFDFVSRGSRGLSMLVLSGTVLGAGIGAMHYTGMLAMRLTYAIRYDPILFGVSIVVAVLLATLALRLMFLNIEINASAKQPRVVATATVMGLAIALMHYTGMASTHFVQLNEHMGQIAGIALHGSLVASVIGVAAFVILGFAWLGANIDQRMRNKDANLARSQSVLQAFIDTTLDGIISFDEQGSVKSVNPAGQDIFGYSRDDIVGQRISILVPGFNPATSGNNNFSAPIINVENRSRTLQLEGRHSDGSSRILEMSLSEIKVGDDKIYNAIVRDVTIRNQAAEALIAKQAELRASQQRLDAIVDSVADAVISIDHHGIIHSFNSSAERIFGYAAAEVVGRDVKSLMTEPDQSQHNTYIERFLETGEARIIGSRREVTGRRKDGAPFPLEIAVSRMTWHGNDMFVGVCTDITQRKLDEEKRAELERELRQAQKLESLGTLSGGIAHEINTPVQYVGDNIRFLAGAFQGLTSVYQKIGQLGANADVKNGAWREIAAAARDADLDFLLEEIPSSIAQSLDGVERISEIVRAIKEFSHPDAKEKRAIDINHAIQTTITVCQNQWKYHAEMVTDFDSSLPKIPCLPGEFNQVMLNLIVNATHAIEAAGEKPARRITIATRRRDDKVEIRVGDTGTGIPKENIDKIFDPFFTTKEPGRGTGQGLSISHSIITKKHGGTISVESEVGKGTTFIVRLPLEDDVSGEVAA